MIIKVKVFPNSKESHVVEGDVWKVYVKSKPHNNVANQELIKILKERFSTVKILRGLKSRNKILEVL